MNSKITFGVHFMIRVDKLKEGKAPVYVRITVNTERILIGLKQWIEPRAWDERKGAGKGSKKTTQDLNHYLTEIRTELGECYRELQLKKKVITAEDVKNTFQRVDEIDHSLIALFEYHNEKEKHKLNCNTLSHYETSQRYLKEFIATHFRKKDLSLKDINYKFIADFENFLRDYQPEKNKKPIGNSGAMTHLIRLKKMLNLAINLEWLDRSPFRNFKIKIRHEQREFLSKTELLKIQAKKFSLARLDYVRDLFIFSCYTGLAYVDVQKLTPADISQAPDGNKWLHTTRQKTSVVVRTPLLPKADLIIKKYGNDPRSINNGKLFPLITNQKMNSYLKEIADLCGVNKNLTFHMARHTFATTVTLSNGVPIETVSKLLGHTKIPTTQIYAKVIQQKVSEDMLKLQEELKKQKF